MKDSFKDLGLSEATLLAVQRIGYQVPTPVQVRAIPPALQGRDVIVGAKTGTGKTAAFSLPIVEKLGHAREEKAPAVLILSPTRELVKQTESVLNDLTRSSKIRVTSIIGGVAYQGQLKQLRRGVDIVVATPGRLIDIMERGNVNLGSVEMLVLDEADRMLDMGFLPAIKTIIEQIPEQRQTMLFSATIDKKALKGIAGVLKDPLSIEISPRGEAAETIEQSMIPVEQRAKPALLQSVLEKYGSSRVIVFTRTKRRADTCAQQLYDAGFYAESIHSEKSQRQRQQSLKNFAKGKTGILVATDVLARGIDVTDVESVINYDLPDSPDDYVHRIGRTGRAGGNGIALSFVSKETRSNLADIERLMGKKIPALNVETLEELSYDRGSEPSKKHKRKNASSDFQQEGGKNFRSARKHTARSSSEYKQGGAKRKGAQSGGSKAKSAKWNDAKPGGSKSGEGKWDNDKSGSKSGGKSSGLKPGVRSSGLQSEGRSGSRRDTKQGFKQNSSFGAKRSQKNKAPRNFSDSEQTTQQDSGQSQKNKTYKAAGAQHKGRGAQARNKAAGYRGKGQKESFSQGGKPRGSKPQGGKGQKGSARAMSRKVTSPSTVS